MPTSYASYTCPESVHLERGIPALPLHLELPDRGNISRNCSTSQDLSVQKRRGHNGDPDIFEERHPLGNLLHCPHQP